MISTVLSSDNDKIIDRRGQRGVPVIVAKDLMCVRELFAVRCRIHHDDLETHHCAEFGKGFRDTTVPKNPDHRRRDHRLDVNFHVAPTGHPCTEYFVVEVYIYDLRRPGFEGND